MIRRDTLEKVAATSKMRINNEYDNFKKSFNAEEIIRRARKDASFLGRKEYNVIANNCEHFAIWCRNGDFISNQIIRFEPILKMSGLYPQNDDKWWEYRQLHPNERNRSWFGCVLYYISLIFIIYKKEILLCCNLLLLIPLHYFALMHGKYNGFIGLDKERRLKGCVLLFGELILTLILLFSQILDFWLSHFGIFTDIVFLGIYLFFTYVRIKLLLMPFF